METTKPEKTGVTLFPNDSNKFKIKAIYQLNVEVSFYKIGKNLPTHFSSDGKVIFLLIKFLFMSRTNFSWKF